MESKPKKPRKQHTQDISVIISDITNRIQDCKDDINDCNDEIDKLTPLIAKLFEIKMTSPDAVINLETFEVVPQAEKVPHVIKVKSPKKTKKNISPEVSSV